MCVWMIWDDEVWARYILYVHSCMFLCVENFNIPLEFIRVCFFCASFFFPLVSVDCLFLCMQKSILCIFRCINIGKLQARKPILKNLFERSMPVCVCGYTKSFSSSARGHKITTTGKIVHHITHKMHCAHNMHQTVMYLIWYAYTMKFIQINITYV